MSLISQLQFLTLTDDIVIQDGDVGCSKLYDKNAAVASQEHPYITEKEGYTTGRGITWTPRNKRPDKIRESLKEFENVLSSQKCVALLWNSPNVIQFVFQKGLLVLLQIADSVNIERITFDRYFVGKLASDNVTDVLMSEGRVLIAYGDAKLTYVYFGKKQTTSSSSDKWEKLSSLDPRLVTIDLVGPSNRKFDRRLSVNTSQDLLLIWWPTRSFDLWPWMPLTSDRERANAVIYAVTGPSMELLSYARTEGELVSACFSPRDPNQVVTVEEHISKKDKISVNICVYHVAKGRFQQTSLTTIPLQGHVACCQWSPLGDHLLIACSDMAVIMFDGHRAITKLTTALFVPIEVAWHREGTVAILACEKGQLQCFDIALSSIKLQLLSDDFQPTKKLEISSYFRKNPALLRLLWEPAGSRSLCLLFNNGPVALMNFSTGVVTRGILSPVELVCQYLKAGSVDEAIGLLKGLNWSSQSENSFQCVTRIINFLLRRPLNNVSEEQIEATLGTFYELGQPLPETVIAEYRDRVGRLARRFFHQLLRHERLEKAFLLAVDLGCRDLFLDLHHLAVEKGEATLADVAQQKAEQLDTRSMTSTSCEESTEEDASESSDDPSQGFSRIGRKSTRDPGEFLREAQDVRHFDNAVQTPRRPDTKIPQRNVKPFEEPKIPPKSDAVKKQQFQVPVAGPSCDNKPQPTAQHRNYYDLPLNKRELSSAPPVVRDDRSQFHKNSSFGAPHLLDRSQNYDVPPELPPRTRDVRTPANNENHGFQTPFSDNNQRYVEPHGVDASPDPRRLAGGDATRRHAMYDRQGNLDIRTLRMVQREPLQIPGRQTDEVVYARHAIVEDSPDEDLEGVKCVHFGIV